MVSALMERAFGASVGQGLEDPAPTVTAGGGGKSSMVSLKLSPEHDAGVRRVAALLISYYGTENISSCDAPAPTINTKDRLTEELQAVISRCRDDIASPFSIGALIA